MKKQEVIALILAGGQGARLGKLTKNIAKPAIPFGSKYRIIDFTLSNCINSKIYNVGVLTQYKPLELNEHIGNGEAWGFNRIDGGIRILPPYQREDGGVWYKGTANAVYQNIDFIDRYNPDYILILSGDHIYKMDYRKMLSYHKIKEADGTIGVIEVPIKEANRFGIMNVRDDNSIYKFEEKPEKPKSNKASMGIYIFKWELLKKILIKDDLDLNSKNDFGKNIIPKMIEEGARVVAYPFKGYWKDVGTVESLWQANMDLLNRENEFDIDDNEWPIYSVRLNSKATYIGREGSIRNSIIGDGCRIYGEVQDSIVFENVTINKDSYIKNSIVMGGSTIGSKSSLENSIVSNNEHIKEWEQIGNESTVTIVKSE